jgi:periplasmic divalent cation tolerance protein
MSNLICAMTTTNTEREAKNLASLMVEGRLAASVQVISKINSIYIWEGAVHDDQEYLLIIKTKEGMVGKIKKLLEKEHSYEVPEFVVLPIIDASADYQEWIENAVK